MTTYVGTPAVSAIFQGSTPLLEAYLGDLLVYASYTILPQENAYNGYDGVGDKGGGTASAGFTLNTNGTVTASGGTTSPYTNWNISGGSYISYKIISSSKIGFPSFTAPMAASDDGSVRVQMNANRSFIASAGASASQANNETRTYTEEYDIIIEVSVWSAATGGTILAKVRYSISVNASFYYTGNID